MASRVHTCVLLLVCITGITVCHAQPLAVIDLTDSTFEHETQAATGQTTGHWCVLFVNSSQADAPVQIAAEDAWHQLAEDEEKTTIMAKVDVASSGQLAARFNLSSTPTAILLRDRAMYSIDLAAVGGTDADRLVAAVQTFLQGGYEQQAPQPVPAPPSLLSAVKEFASQLNVQPNWMLVAGVACMAAGTLLFLAFLIAGIWYALPERPAKPAPAAEASKPAAQPGAGDHDADDSGEVAKESGESKPSSTRVTRRRA